MSLSFVYRDLPEPEKGVFEQEILQAPYDVPLAELEHLLARPFPFSPTERRWLQRYCELAAFQQEQGHLQVPRTYSPALQSWAFIQRQTAKRGQLIPGAATGA